MKHSGQLTWESPVEIPVAKAYALSILVRLYACRIEAKGGNDKNTYLYTGERYMNAPTTLTEDHVLVIGSVWAYLSAVIDKKGLKTADEVDDFVSTDSYGPDDWVEKHPARVAASEDYLFGLVGKFVC